MRLIDADKLSPDCMFNKNGTRGFAISQSQVANALPVEAIPKADYEALKRADMVAMLQDLDLQIDESAAYNREVAKVQRLIRDRIDKLNGEQT